MFAIISKICYAGITSGIFSFHLFKFLNSRNAMISSIKYEERRNVYVATASKFYFDLFVYLWDESINLHFTRNYYRITNACKGIVEQ